MGTVSPGSSAGSVALKWLDLLAKNRANPATGVPEKELLHSREREFLGELKIRLLREPSGWGDVLEVLCEDDPRLGRQIVASLRDAVGEGSDPSLASLLKTGRHREIRMAAARLISGRDSSESLWALVAAAQEDPDAGVRYQALSELVVRRDRSATPTDTATIDRLMHLRAEMDSDAEVRTIALRAIAHPGGKDASASVAVPGAPRKN